MIVSKISVMIYSVSVFPKYSWMKLVHFENGVSGFIIFFSITILNAILRFYNFGYVFYLLCSWLQRDIRLDGSVPRHSILSFVTFYLLNF